MIYLALQKGRTLLFSFARLRGTLKRCTYERRHKAFLSLLAEYPFQLSKSSEQTLQHRHPNRCQLRLEELWRVPVPYRKVFDFTESNPRQFEIRDCLFPLLPPLG